LVTVEEENPEEVEDYDLEDDIEKIALRRMRSKMSMVRGAGGEAGGKKLIQKRI
jgi:hypothetical protein